MKRFTPRASALLCGLVLVCAGGLYAAWNTAQAGPPAVPRLFEMRTYITNEGKLDALNARFRDHTNRLFVKHGITLIGYWTPTDEPAKSNTLIYILAYPSKEASEASWKAFRADPEWNAAREASEKDGKILKEVKSVFLTGTDYSPIR